MPYYIIPPKFDIEAILARAVQVYANEFGKPPKAIAIDFNEETLLVDGEKVYAFEALL